ncbi:MAG: hypothetical protein HYY46_11510, partial [Deltaproteobacteria bacterium]|nr:hypothetical protein [Deltaproteobacteria bacterium]
LQQSGVDPARASLLVIGSGATMLTALRTGRIAAGLLNPPFNFLTYREGLKNLGFAGSFVRIPSTGLVTMRERLERKPDQIRRMARALSRARAFAREQKPAVLPTLGRFLRIEDEDMLSKIYDYHQGAETPDGRIDAALAAETIREARLTQGVAKEIPVEQLFDFSYLTPPR